MRNRWVAAIVLLCAGLAWAQYQIARPGYRYEFPRDHFNHPEYQTEWWYYTGNLKAADGHRFGFELTFFRQGVNREAAQGTWDVRDLYFAHFALSDLDGGRFYHTERFNRQGPGIAGASLELKRIWNGNWQVEWLGDRQQLRGVTEQVGVVLALTSRKPPIVHGENGVSQKAAGEGHASHYVSFTRLLADGTIALNGKNYAVEGSAWMDHEFFTNTLGAEEVGWDWLSLQFEDNTEVMLYRLRHKDGSVDPYSSATYVDTEGRASHLRLQDFTMSPVGNANWTSSTSGATYPLVWEVTIPRYGIELQVRTSLRSQELTGRNKASPNYWEGAVEATGRRGGQPFHGVGYLELTGYDRPLPLSGPGR